MDQNFHKDHLACHQCDKKLVACRYILKEEQPYCIPCYQEAFAHSCEECKKPIGPDYKVRIGCMYFLSVWCFLLFNLFVMRMARCMLCSLLSRMKREVARNLLYLIT